MLHEISFQIIISSQKTGLHSYCKICYSRDGVNQMWILKTSKHLLEYIYTRFLSSCNRIHIFDFSTFYTPVPYSKLEE